MAYRVDFTPHADRQIRKMEPAVRHRIAAKIESLAEEPRQMGVEKMAGAELYRVRAGRDYRIVFEIHDRVLVIVIVKVGDRKDVYR